MKIDLADSGLLTIRQAAKLLNVHPDTLRRWERAGKLKSIRVGSRRDRRYRNEDLYELIKDSGSFHAVDSRKKRSQRRNLKKTLKKANWVFFDVGYTLMSLFPSREDVYADIAYDRGYNLDPKNINYHFSKLGEEWDKEKILAQPLTKASKETVSAHYAHFNAEVLMRSGIPRKDKAKAISIGKQIFNAIFSDSSLWRIFPGVEEVLSLLEKQGTHLGIVENWDGRLKQFMKHWQLDRYFDFIVSGGALKLRKPDPHIFQLALDEAGVSADSVVHIGDKQTEDALGPQELGITPILFDRQRDYKDLDCFKFYKYQELVSLLR